jgi:hypothetical protein
MTAFGCDFNRWCCRTRRQHGIGPPQTYCLDVEDTYRDIKDVEMVPNLSPQNLASIEIGKDFMLKHGYIKNNFDVAKWAAPEFLEQAVKELAQEEWEKIQTEKLSIPSGRLG